MSKETKIHRSNLLYEDAFINEPKEPVKCDHCGYTFPWGQGHFCVGPAESITFQELMDNMQMLEEMTPLDDEIIGIKMNVDFYHELTMSDFVTVRTITDKSFKFHGFPITIDNTVKTWQPIYRENEDLRFMQPTPEQIEESGIKFKEYKGPQEDESINDILKLNEDINTDIKTWES